VTQPPPSFLIPPGEPFAGQEVLSRFTLVECVGEGAQGVVWRAVARTTKETVALKFVRPTGESSLGRASSRRGRLAVAQRELAALRLLELPGLVHLVDAGEHERCLVVAMAWVEGRPFPGPRDGARWEQLSDVAIALLATLQRLHGVGLAHRDLKPSNVLIDAEGRPVLLDLGVAGGGRCAPHTTTRGPRATNRPRSSRARPPPRRRTCSRSA
jgi:serine/threonine protein kinase